MDKILTFMQTNSEYIMTITTMIIGIVQGFVTNFKKKKTQIIFTVCIAIAFIIITWFTFDDLYIVLTAFLGAAVWFFFLFFVVFRKKEVVKRKKLDRMLRRFTADADREQPLCIFGGDLDFFGDYIKEDIAQQHAEHWWQLWKKPKLKNDITKNKQFIQIIGDKNGDCFREIHILSIRPCADNDKHRRARIRIGFLREKLGDSLKIKFFTEQTECKACDKYSNCYTCDICSECPDKNACTHKVDYCEKLQKKSKNSCFNPDMKLRGRFIQKKENDSRSAAIVTTNEPGKSYILKEYNNITKEYSVYQKIWEIWWLKCEYDWDFIDKCTAEYNEYKNG